MGLTLRAVLLVVLLAAVGCFERIDDYDELMRYHQENSQFPIIHIYHNRHFSSSPQFQDFLQVIEETEFRCKDYARFVLTDCENFQQGETFACDDLRHTKDNHIVFGYFPTNGFINYAGKKMQNPPGNRHLNHHSDVYLVEEMQAFIDEMIPNFFEEITSLEEYHQWLQVRHTPKLLFASREEDVPLVIRKLGVHFFLRYDLAFLNDLTETVTKQLNLTDFPRLLVLQFNYKENIYEMTEWEGNEFSAREYLPLRDFLQPLARKQPRNDLLFHKMQALPDKGVVSIAEKHELQQVLDEAGGWLIVSSIKGDPLQLRMLRERYGRFFEYVHYQTANESETLQIYDPEKKKMFDLPTGQIKFKAVGKEDFIQTMAAWIRKGYVLIGVRERYGHFCAIAQATLFRGLTQCLIVKEDDYEAVSAALKMDFDYGFGCYETNEQVKERIAGRNFRSTQYEDVFQSIQYLTRLKSKEIIEDFMDNPIKTISVTTPLTELCASNNKKCALLLTPSGKTDRTAYDYLKDIAVEFINDYHFFEVELSCNPELEQAAKKGGLLVYHPTTNKYVALKAKLSKSTFERFLKANLSDNQKLPLHAFSNDKLEVKKCEAPKSLPDEAL